MSPFSEKNLVSKKISRAYDPSILRVTHTDVFIEKSIKNLYQFILVLHQSLSKYEETVKAKIKDSSSEMIPSLHGKSPLFLKKSLL
jgi:hypothetical protein